MSLDSQEAPFDTVDVPRALNSLWIAAAFRS